MRKVTIETIRIELSELGLELISNEYKKNKNILVSCNCKREFKSTIYKIRKGGRCYFCNHFSMIKMIAERLKEIQLTDSQLKKLMKSKDLEFEISKFKKRSLSKREIKRNLVLNRVPINIIDQIKYFYSIGLSDFKISRKIRELNNYLISRTKVKNIIEFIKVE